jgi:hypothetical protein
MHMKTHYKIILMILLAAGIVFALSGAARPTAAQAQGNSLRTLFENLRDNHSQVTVEFVKPLITGEATWTLPDDAIGRKIGEVGEDYVCFSEPWNDTTRDRCTPFSNITSVSFVR